MLIALAMLVGAQLPSAPRSEVPIQERILSDGTRRYAVPLSVAGNTIEAGLDSGSVGLRALPDAAQGANAVGADQSYRYGVGTELVGPNARAPVAIGALAGTIQIQAVRAIGCGENRPNCPARKLTPAEFGIQGNGLPGQGFRAILGTGMAAANLPNPLVALGVHRWIIELPVPGQKGFGRLILNPSNEETEGFVPLKLASRSRDRRNDAVVSCLGRSDGPWKVCASTLIDTGAPGIEVVNHSGPAWADGTAGYIEFASTAAASPTIRFTSGLRTQASHFMFTRDERIQEPVIRSGLIAYFAYDVLYDADADLVLVRSRPSYSGGPEAKP